MMCSLRATLPRYGALLGCAISILSGCSKQGTVETFPVRGTVTLDGKAAPGASVWLLSAMDAGSDSAKPPDVLIGGVANEQGEFELYTNGTQKGVPEGYYMVGISWPDPSVEVDREGGERGKDLMPEHVRNPQKSGLDYEVVANEAPPPLILEITTKPSP